MLPKHLRLSRSCSEIINIPNHNPVAPPSTDHRLEEEKFPHKVVGRLIAWKGRIQTTQSTFHKRAAITGSKVGCDLTKREV